MRDPSPRTLMLSLALLLTTPGVVSAQGGPMPPSCESVAGFHKLDFWVGEWEVSAPDGTRQGDNRIEKVLQGCAIIEHWRSAGGGEGKSLFYYDANADVWKQVWVTSLATATGALKEKQLVEELPGGGVRFQGEITRPDGVTYLDRTTLEPLEDGRVRQTIEVSTDGGESWGNAWVGLYERTDG